MVGAESDGEWKSSCLAQFSDFLGMPTTGCEEEILTMLKKWIMRKDQKNRRSGAKRVKVESSKFVRELKRLECSINFKSSGHGRALFQESGGSVSEDSWSGTLLILGVMARGVLVFWDTRVLELIEMEIGNFSVSCRFKNVEDGFCWVFTRVYGPVVGRFLGERNNSLRLSSAMRRFSEIIEDLELRDLLLQGGSFTWRGGLNNQIQSRGTRKGPSPFRFENMWLKEEGFKDLLRNWWMGFQFRGSFSFTLFENLKVLKACLKIWNREVFGNVTARKESALKQMMFWAPIEGDRVLTTEK
ncbi:hypothetical protein CK203_031207 [Vitis vinifera]|uniref:Uncharacterized protein n=1 Tax=Vitis vinifera TaxID=29760 RepID=A0A438J0N5_VITVI|nr:hypothetical protein CK203_031207 [Vitis vinifera]